MIEDEVCTSLIGYMSMHTHNVLHGTIAIRQSEIFISEVFSFRKSITKNS